MINWKSLLLSFYNWNIAFGATILATAIFVAIFAPLIAPFHYAEQNFVETLDPPSITHLFGTDRLGRDIFSRVIYATRTAFLSAFLAATLAGVIGVMFGLIGGYIGGWLDRVIQSLIDISYSFPTILIAIALVVVMTPGQGSIIIAIVIGWWPYYARIVRGEVLATRGEDFVEAARAIGSNRIRIMLKEVLPNTIPMVIVLMSVTMGQVILITTLLSFLGIGIQPPKASWGMMLSDGRDYLIRAPWISIFPGVAISIVVLGFNLLGDGIRDQLDPYLKI